MAEDYEWIISLRHQVETLARRNELASSCTFVHNRTKEMAAKIIRLRELIPSNPSEAAKFYVECAREMDAIGRIVRRTTRRERGRRRGNRVADGEGHSFSGSTSIHSEIEEETTDSSERRKESKETRRGLLRIVCLPRDDQFRQGSDGEVRNLWKTQTEFFLSCLGFIVGVGNTLRFPAKVYQHGGGVFFIPYVLCLVLFGLPIVYMHLCIGQFSGLSASGAFGKLMPIASGLGWALVLLAVPVCIYYNIIVAWAVYYFWFSFRGFVRGIGLPWDRCLDSWVANYNCCDLHSLTTCFNHTAITAPEAYFHFEVLHRPVSGNFELGPIQEHLVIALAVAWILVFFGVFKGIGSIGGMYSVTATVPYLLLTILFLRGTSLPGASDGLAFLFTPNFEKLWSLPMWKSAAEQVFYELGIDAGPLIAMASFSRYRNNIYRDAVLLVFFDAITSVLCGMVIFSFIGFLAHMSGSEVDTVLQHDPLYLAFTVYPGVTSFMHLGPLWAALFFAMLALSALDAEFAWLEMLASSVMYQCGSKNKRVENRILVSMCILFFIFGLPLCARGGIYIFHAIESLNANWNSFSLGLMQMLLVCFVYGVDNFLEDIAGMLRLAVPGDVDSLPFRERVKFTFGPVGPYVKWAWSLFCPAILTALLVASAVSYERVTFENQTMPWGYELTAWLAMVAPLAVIPFTAIYTVVDVRRRGKPLMSLLSTSNWRRKPKAEAAPAEPTSKYRPPIGDGYTYIDPVSRGQSTKSRTVGEEEYGRRTGRIAGFLQAQTLMEEVDEHTNTNTYGEGTYGVGSTSRSSPTGRADAIPLRTLSPSHLQVPSVTLSSMHSAPSLPLFGSPPVSAANSIDMRSRRQKFSDRQRSRMSDEHSSFERMEHDVYGEAPSPPHSTPPSRVRALERAVNDAFNETIVPRIRSSSAQDEYGIRIAKAISASGMSEPSRPSWNRRSSAESSSSTTSSSGRPDRPTVIRRYTSSDSLSIAAPSSVSITPLDREHHRSMSSIAIFDQTEVARKQPKLSQLKRPKPIDAPSSLGPSPATSHF